MSARPLPLAELPITPPPLPWRTTARPAAPTRPTALAPRLEPAALGEILDGLAQAVELWRPHLRHDAHQRARVRLLDTPAYEVWLIGWLPGQSTELHDHGGSNAAYVVVDGELAISSSVPASDAESHGGNGHVAALGLPLEHRVLRAGQTVTVPAGHVHQVANRSAAPAASLHAYSRPLRSMGVFDEHGDICGHRLRTVWVDEQQSVLGSAPHC